MNGNSEPPEPSGGPALALRRIEFVKQLQARPGIWVIFGRYSRNGGGSAQAKFKAAGCEATCRKNDDGSQSLYVRWPAASGVRGAQTATAEEK